MTIYIFSKKRVLKEDFDDGNGNKVDLYDHLEYVYNKRGTPDCIKIIENIPIKDVIEKYSPKDYVLVVEGTFRSILGEGRYEDI